MSDLTTSHYATGTATVAANGTIVTFQSAGTLSAVIRRGDLFGTHAGAAVRISEIGPATGLTANQIRLAYPWRGPAQTAAAYEIQRTPYEMGYQQAVEDFVVAFGAGNIPALAALTLAANKGIHATGANTLATHDLTAWARNNLLAAANALSVRQNIDVQRGFVGPFAPQPNTVGMTNGDFNAVDQHGVYTITGEWINGPSGADPVNYGASILEVQRREFGQVFQIARLANGTVSERYNFGAWRQVLFADQWSFISRGRIGFAGAPANANELVLPGYYYAQDVGNATLANNFPLAGRGVLEVLPMVDPSHALAPRIIQIWQHSGGRRFTRFIDGTSVAAWVET